MKKVFSCVCKKCWHMWTSYTIQNKCPKCGATNIDVENDLMWEK